jgi:hypothetical protein
MLRSFIKSFSLALENDLGKHMMTTRGFKAYDLQPAWDVLCSLPKLDTLHLDALYLTKMNGSTEEENRYSVRHLAPYGEALPRIIEEKPEKGGHAQFRSGFRPEARILGTDLMKLPVLVNCTGKQ